MKKMSCKKKLCFITDLLLFTVSIQDLWLFVKSAPPLPLSRKQTQFRHKFTLYLVLVWCRERKGIGGGQRPHKPPVSQ